MGKQKDDFDATIAFIESQFGPNGHMENVFMPNIIIYMMDTMQKVAKDNKNTLEAQKNDGLNKEIQQWDNIEKVLSEADKVRESLEKEIKFFGGKRGENEE